MNYREELRKDLKASRALLDQKIIARNSKEYKANFFQIEREIREERIKIETINSRLRNLNKFKCEVPEIAFLTK